MRIYLIIIYAIAILPINYLSISNIGGYDTLLAINQIERSISKSLITEWVPHSSYFFPFVVNFMNIFIDSPENINLFLYLLNNFLFACLSYLISESVFSSKFITSSCFILSGLFFSNFMGVFYWDHLGFTLSLMLLFVYQKNKNIILISLLCYALFLTKIQIFIATTFGLYVIIILDIIKKRISYKFFLKLIIIKIFITLIITIVILNIYGFDFYKEYFGYIYGRYISIDPNIPFSNKSIGSNYSISRLIETIAFPLKIFPHKIGLNFTVLNFALQLVFYFAYIIIFQKIDYKQNILTFLVASFIIISAYLGRGYLTLMGYYPLIFLIVIEKFLTIKFQKILISILIFIFGLLYFNEIYNFKKIILTKKIEIAPLRSNKGFIIKKNTDLHYNYINERDNNKIFNKINKQLNFIKDQKYLSDNFYIFGHHLQTLFFLDGRDFNNKYPFTRVLDENIFSKNFKNLNNYQSEEIIRINNCNYILLHNFEYSIQQLERIEQIYLQNFKLFKKKEDISIYIKK